MAKDHLQRDLELCKRLVKEVFDPEKDLAFPFDRLETELDTDEKRLDTLLLYMR